MGAFLTKAKGHFVTRTRQRYNLEARTERLLNENQSVRVAPRYRTDVDMLEKVRNEHDSEQIHGKDDCFQSRLRQVFVESHDPEKGWDPFEYRRKHRPLDPTRYSESGVFKVDANRVIPRGKISLDQVQDLLSLHRQHEGKSSAAALADQYRLDKEQIDSILKFYGIFSLIKIDEKKASESVGALQAGPDWVDADQESKPTAAVTMQSSGKAPLLSHK